MLVSPADTLTIDSALLMQWQQDPAYAYHKELVAPDKSFLDWIGSAIQYSLNSLLGSEIITEYSTILLIVLFLVILSGILWFLYQRNPKLFMFNKKDQLSYNLEEETIYGIDFQERILQAQSKQDFKEAIRLLYLQTLKQLSDEQRIDWQIYKTPTQYVHEVKQPVFSQFTNHFLRVRYGNFIADEELFHTMEKLQRKIKEGGGL
ncbi:DUF4129 domain-containing protein [uncultured Bacteroides sp.]|uniref:DUF4129 domain-containing protein n=1 Tax=uncultured Bacteroides sp. TaxID=162156 RepID=UPI002607EDF0|nr:DUF4129 domain-containing protein [uncultured Bacteroides sp.]